MAKLRLKSVNRSHSSETSMAFLIVCFCALPSVPAPECDQGTLGTLVVQPSRIISDNTSPRSLVQVTALDTQGGLMCLVEVLFESDNTEQVIFPHPKAISNQDGIAVNYIQRIIANPSNVKTAIWVSSGSVRIGPIPVIGLGRITDLFPFNFNAPPLAAFDGRRQILLGGFGYITPMPVGTKVRAWAIDPTVAEPSVGTIISSPINAHQQPILFEVIAHKLGTTVFILESTDNSIYEARITGVLDPEFIRGDCDGNRVLAITDAITALEYLFRGRASPPVREACNTNDDRRLDVTDAVYLLMHLSLSGPEPPPPYPDPGTDPTP